MPDLGLPLVSVGITDVLLVDIQNDNDDGIGVIQVVVISYVEEVDVVFGSVSLNVTVSLVLNSGQAAITIDLLAIVTTVLIYL
ncbi:hypothetical protein DGG96_01295 [Legionella qingyii]|uniref:Uncharacterized protein n=1 Tax=Legionella qingyii TaxID=2184757 RepID=A0A317U795_9GAMM|nr:hypothetical protein [Legionella qingyii]PWY57379.1 hypothetical protein DGG96_01295 [Legionella qingyii]